MATDDDSPYDTGPTHDLFRADTDRKPGAGNVTVAGFDIQPWVFGISMGLIVLFIVYTVAFPASAEANFEALFDGINHYFGWFYIIAANLFIIVVLFFAFSRFGNIKLGGPDAQKEFSNASWIAMLFSAGMGIGLMFWSVGEPMWHMADPLFGVEGMDWELFEDTGEAAIGQPEAAAEVAMAVTFFHWAFHPWAIYGVVGLALAFFAYNRGLPLTFRSVFWPVLGDRIYGWPGHVIDILALFATVFGLGTSLGLGALQINAGLSFLGDEVAGVAIPSAVSVQIVIIALITAAATVSVALGIHKGIRVLSNVNVLLMIALMGTVLIVGPTLFLLGFVPQAIGAYFQHFFELSFYTESFGGAAGAQSYEGFQDGWTIFYWGWWIAWSPFVGMFIARISRGRSVREFVLGVLLIPVVFSFLFMGIVGGAALHAQIEGATILNTIAETGQEELAMFELFVTLPLSALLSVVAIVLVTTFFVTSSDSGSLVLGHLSSGGKHRAPRNQRISWAIIEGAVAAVLLLAGGLAALQTASITVGLPFAAVLLFMCYSLYRGLQAEYDILESSEFADRIEELEKDPDVVVRKTGAGVVSDIQDQGSAD